MLTTFDAFFLKIFANFAQKSEVFDKFVIWILPQPTFKLLPLVSALWFLWFTNVDRAKTRLLVVNSAIAVFLALIVSRVIQNFGPQRPRPLHSGNPDYVPPLGVDLSTLENWSSFPSDNAALSFCIATAIFYFSRVFGIFAYLWALIVVCFPRVYGGYHYASDIIAGAIIGIICFWIVHLYNRGLSRAALSITEKVEERHAGIFYAGSFIIFYQIVTMAIDIRRPFAALLNVF